MYYVVGYRRVVVRKNLSMSFPDKLNLDLQQIEKKFYRHFADLIVENIKSTSISNEELYQHVHIVNLELIERYIVNGKSVIGVLGHLGNWEWAILKLGMNATFPVHALFQPSSSRKFDNWMKKNRERFGAILNSTREMRKVMHTMDKYPIGIGFLADQTPVNVEKAYWMRFMKQDTPIYLGAERLAKKHNTAVVYVDVAKKGRGQYEIKFDLITDEANNMKEYEITHIHTKMLEASINRQPEIWLWSHRRWKRSHLKPSSLKINN